MPASTSKDRRHIMITLHLDGWTKKEIAQVVRTSPKTVQRVLALYRQYGQATRPYILRPGRPRHLVNADLDYIIGLLSAQPTLYLDEIRDRLFEAREIHVSIATISRTLTRLARTNKAVSNEAKERDDRLRAVWKAVIGREDDPRSFVWLDETAVDNLTTQRRHGWSIIGQGCVQRATFLKGVKYSALPAMTIEGMIALEIFEGSVNKERFLLFLREQVAPKLGRYPGPRSIVVLDNCAIHHDEEIRKVVVDECGSKLVYLPPYSPDLNPIEQAFAFIKAWLRRHEVQARQKEYLPELIAEAMAAVTPELAQEWAANCGYL